MELVLDVGDARLPATLSLPDVAVRGGVVGLHGSSDPSRHHPLYTHLVRTLTPLGVAVLRYDRRPWADGDVPLAVQANDAMAAVRLLRERIREPVALWGYSQGAWAAAVATAEHPAEVDSLVAVSSAGVSPSAQMRYGTAEQLRRNGFPEHVGESLALRTAYEDYLRGHRDRSSTQAMVDRAATQPWFAHAYVRRTLPAPSAWPDLDFEPETVFARVRCPVLACYGENDEWVPVEESIATWRRAGEQVTVVRLPGCGHEPSGPAYTDALARWFT